MSSRPLRKCPTCFRALDEMARRGMGLRNGEILNSLCPGLIGPSDIDHVLHNGHSRPEIVQFFEYKSDGATMSRGQEILANALRGDWQNLLYPGRLLTIRFTVFPQMPQPQDLQMLRDTVVAMNFPRPFAVSA